MRVMMGVITHHKTKKTLTSSRAREHLSEIERMTCSDTVRDSSVFESFRDVWRAVGKTEDVLCRADWDKSIALRSWTTLCGRLQVQSASGITACVMSQRMVSFHMIAGSYPLAIVYRKLELELCSSHSPCHRACVDPQHAWSRASQKTFLSATTATIDPLRRRSLSSNSCTVVTSRSSADIDRCGNLESSRQLLYVHTSAA